jgi:hypothetical protein
MVNKTTTSTGLILIGLSSFANVASTSSLGNYDINVAEKIYEIESEYNAPAIEKSRVDSYVDFYYKMDDNLANKYSLVDYGFMNSMQKFAKEQIELDEDFSKALDDLFLSKVNAKPSKKRF